MNEAFWDPGAFRSGDALLVHTRTRWWDPRDWFARKIQRTTGSPWNHVGVIVWNRWAKRWDVVEALFYGGVVQRPLAAYLTGEYDLAAGSERDLTDGMRANIAAWVQGQTGKEYNWRKVLAIRALQFAGLDPGSIDEITDDEPDTFICSGLFVWSRRIAGRRLVHPDGQPVGTFAAPRSVAESIEIRWRYPEP